MNIYFEYSPYSGGTFKNEKGEKISYETIKDTFFNLNGRKGKLIYQGKTRIYEQGFSAEFNNYGFVFQDDLSSISLQYPLEKVLLESVI